MSDVKMCDNCGELFSVNVPGWIQYASQETAQNFQSSQPVVVQTKTLHMGPCCNNNSGTGQMKPRLSIEAAKDMD